MEDEGYLGMAVDGRGVLVRTIASDPGHCLGSGLVKRARLPRLVARLLAPDLFSGWGVRTLSSEHPAYDPFAYHRATVWPVENATFAVELARRGFVREMHALCKAQFEAAALFDHARLPELFSGHPRDAAHPFPALYPRADCLRPGPRPRSWGCSMPSLASRCVAPDAERRPEAPGVAAGDHRPRAPGRGGDGEPSLRARRRSHASRGTGVRGTLARHPGAPAPRAGRMNGGVTHSGVGHAFPARRRVEVGTSLSRHSEAGVSRGNDRQNVVSSRVDRTSTSPAWARAISRTM